jgi:transposase
VPTLTDQIEDPNCHLPETARGIFKVLIATLASLDEDIAVLDIEIGRRAKEDPVARRLMTILGAGPITATAIVACRWLRHSELARTLRPGSV